jgi:hypothetical protein
MIDVIEGLPDAVVGLAAVGEVDSTDYETVAAPAVKRTLERHPKFRLLHVLDERFAGYTTGAHDKTPYSGSPMSAPLTGSASSRTPQASVDS